MEYVSMTTRHIYRDDLLSDLLEGPGDLDVGAIEPKNRKASQAAKARNSTPFANNVKVGKLQFRRVAGIKVIKRKEGLYALSYVHPLPHERHTSIEGEKAIIAIVQMLIKMVDRLLDTAMDDDEADIEDDEDEEED